MRRILHTLIAAGSVAILAACGQGGSAFSTNGQQADRVVVSGFNGTGFVAVVPGAPTILSAAAVKGSQNVINNDSQNFSWTVAIQSGGQYQASAAGVQRTCPTVPPAPLPQPGSAGSFAVVQPGNSSNLTITPPPGSGLPALAGAPAAYCLAVSAIYNPTGATGTAVVYVSAAPAP